MTDIRTKIVNVLREHDEVRNIGRLVDELVKALSTGDEPVKTAPVAVVKMAQFLLEDCASYIDTLHSRHKTKPLDIGIDTGKVREASAALSAQVQDVAGWQPIDTAPQDDTKFLFIEESGRIQVGRMDAEWGEEKSVFVCLTGGARDWYPSIKPTHWMPLPASPAPKHDDSAR